MHGTSLAGRTAVVSGSGRGIGRAIADALADAGATAVILARHADQVDDAVNTIRARGGKAVACVADLRDPAAVEAAWTRIHGEAGDVDILVNNAGINAKRPFVPLPVPPGATVGQPGSGPASVGMTDAEWDAIFDTHVRASLHLVRLFGPGMLARGWGRVINIGSSAVGRAPNLSGPYKVAKGALMHYTAALAKEWAPHGVTVNAISPGHFRTDMSKALHDSPEGQAWLRERIPMGHPGDIRELGALATFLAGERASFITGQMIGVDGGETL
ncbi:SDR family oxidoreductase [Microbacterium sp. zg.Y625]|uniref:SDR family NAD(P)-dependent oxidoreductase n=1 Tax=Microbacterium jiangjiandongii TaxID=3049071 RepID=UPI00214BF142|nr:MULTISPECIES: SDR family NAD(P)-dependent oxidoreductase [unclassified Microbacterium]MCR2793484.1 SDR family oxidoreductase [Microbacterium sp. zg.Y625]WIM25149.1 SDR family NAD(P)-dependent oxidoreductase [Microbacterium sp. zg-Y625]